MLWSRIDRSATIFSIMLVLLIGIAGCVDQVPSSTTDGSEDGSGDGGSVNDDDSSSAGDPGADDVAGGTNDPAEHGLLGTYFDSVSGDVAFSRVDGSPNVFWERNGGEPLDETNLFSVVWEGTIFADERGAYRFTALGDDGVRVLIDGRNVMPDAAWSRWMPGVTRDERVFQSEPVELDGEHDVRIEFFQYDWNAEMRLNWTRPDGTNEPIPASVLRAADSPVSSLPSGVIRSLANVPNDGSSDDSTDDSTGWDPIEPADPPSGTTQMRTYEIDTKTDFKNPERGFHEGVRVYDPGSSYDYSSEENRGFTTVRSYVRLDPYVNDEYLPPEVLEELDEGLEALDDHGLKVILRFSYNFGYENDNPSLGGKDPDIEHVLNHIDQVGGVLRNHSDVIAVLQAGFVGAWGEWHHSQSDLTDRQNAERIMNALLDELPEERSIQLRYPWFITPYVGELEPEHAFTDADVARVGFKNDCFLSNPTDGGTWAEPDSEGKRERMQSLTRYTVAGGETCAIAGLNTRNDCSNAIPSLEAYDFDYLNYNFWRYVYDKDTGRIIGDGVLKKWEDQGCHDEVSRRLGYRIGLMNATYPTSAERGVENSISLRLRNDGFGKVYNPRPIELVLLGPSGTYRVEMVEDARAYLPLGGETRSVNLPFTVPISVPAGTYTAGLALPDPSPTLYDDPRYAIKLANVGMWESDDGWDESAGINDLGVTMTVE